MASNRIIVLVDMDCFYVQVEQRRDPEYKGKPCAVVQYKTYRGGGIIAVGYEARAHGVKRGMMGNDAKGLCPQIHLFRVPESNGKANLDRYREAGAEVITVLSQFGGRVERASIDEAYIDVTDLCDKIITEGKDKNYLLAERLPNTHIIGLPKSQEDGEDKEEIRQRGINEWLQNLHVQNRSMGNLHLSIAAAIVEEIRDAVYHQTGFRCSAGISHNKMLSKLVCGINKPNKQTVLPESSVPDLFQTIKIGKVRNLGGKLGKSLMSDFNVEYMGQIRDIAIEKLAENYGQKTALWLKEVSQGIDHEMVKERHVAQSIGCGKNFFGPDALDTKAKVKHWLDALLMELSERLIKDKASNNRIARTLTVHLKLEAGKSYSRQAPLLKYDHKALLDQSFLMIRPFDSKSTDDEHWHPAIVQLSVNAKKFDNIGGPTACNTPNVSKFFKATQPICKPSQSDDTLHNQHMSCLDDVQGSKFEKKSSDRVNLERTPHDDFPFDDLQSHIMGELEAAYSFATFGNISNRAKTHQPKHTVVSEIERRPTSSKPIRGKSTSKDKKGFFSRRAVTSKECGTEISEDIINTSLDEPPIKFEFVAENPVKLEHKLELENPVKRECGCVFPKSEHNGTASAKVDVPVPKDPNENECAVEDVVVISESHSDSLFQAKTKSMSKTQKLCKIDQMFQKDKENSLKKSQSRANGPLFHPKLGEIDQAVLKDLPDDIRQEVLKSCEISSSMAPFPNNVATTSQISSKRKSPNKGQRLISNFIPQGSRPRKDLPKIASKRKSVSPAMRNKAKLQKNNVRNSTFSTLNSTNDVVPLGFFRQRSQLSNAIAKAISKDQRSSTTLFSVNE